MELIDEIAVIFNKININKEAVLKVAGSKWNFLSFRPYLVDRHRIKVDPYYWVYKY